MERLRTAIEQRLDKMMAVYPDNPNAERLTARIAAAVDRAVREGVPPELAGYLVAQHAVSYVSALKITSQARPELCDALAEDFLESIKHRAFPGVPTLVTPK